MIIKKIFLLLIFFFTISYVFSQEFPSYTFNEKKKKDKRNSIQVSLGSLLFASSANIFYERIVRKKKLYQTFRIGHNSIVTFGGTAKTISLQTGILTSVMKNSHFESNIGLLYLYNNRYRNDALFSFSIGYRLQKRKKRSMFRSGLGFPELLYLSYGFRF